MKLPAPNLPKADPAYSTADLVRLKPLPKSFYLRDTIQVAKELLGKSLVVHRYNTVLAAKIVETEAYLGKVDPASHAYHGPTRRNLSMFEEGGTCYVYLSYGINFCMNVVTREKGLGEAVLLRAAMPLAGIKVMERLRKTDQRHQLMSGPGKLTQAMGIDLADNGRTFFEKDFKLVEIGNRLKPEALGCSPRIGISKGKEDPFRFFVKNSPWLSRKG